jgi:hypothetical protein
MPMFGSLKKSLLAISPIEASFERRKFENLDSPARGNLEEVLRVFISGYNLTLEVRDYERLTRRFEENFDEHYVGFAFEGAGMCCALLDLLAPGKTSRLRTFTDNAGHNHDYIATVGAGFALARVPYGLRVLDRYMEKLDPSVAWCVLDGYGFHQGVFHHRLFVEQCKEPPAALPKYGRRLFDAGIGRSLWWVKGASPVLIRRATERFPEPRRGELWHGVGVACSYAGGVSEDVLTDLLELSGHYRADFLSGVPFAARMRQKGGNPSKSTDLACRRLLKMSSDQAADMLVDYMDQLSTEWTGTQQELGRKGYTLIRERVTQNFQYEEKSALAFQ